MLPDLNQPNKYDVVIGVRSQPFQASLDAVVLGSFETGERNLHNLLKQQQWQAADLETTALMLDLGDRKKEGFLRIEDIHNLDYHRLQIIDNLWTTYSQNRFGFSVQVQIWHSVGGTSAPDWNTWCRFGTATGWYTSTGWSYWNDVQFSLDVPRGHLPRGGAIMGWGLGDFWVGCEALSAIGKKLRG